jgi:hypothetical protein
MTIATRWYIPQSSYFDAHPYRASTLKVLVADAGGKNIRTSNYRGWRNQPAVVTFSAGPVTVQRIEKLLQKRVHWSVRVDKKSW